MDNIEQNTISHLNTSLTHVLTGINQYFLHARVLKHNGLVALADYEYKQSIEMMKHADQLVNRVLALGGLPNLQDSGKLMIGESASEILACDFALEEMSLVNIQRAHDFCQKQQDRACAELLARIIAGAHNHMQFIKGELESIDQQGHEAYLSNAQSQTGIETIRKSNV